jgi:hypothetical protein
VGDDVLIDGETFLLTDFVNLKIKPVQFFRGAYRCMVCVRVLIEMSIYTCMNIYIYTVFFKKKLFLPKRASVNESLSGLTAVMLEWVCYLLRMDTRTARTIRATSIRLGCNTACARAVAVPSRT